MPETKTLGRGSTNQSFMRPRTAGGKSFAITTSTFPSYQALNILGDFFQQLHFEDTFAERFRYGVLVVAAREGERQGKSEINAELSFVKIGEIIHKGQGAP